MATVEKGKLNNRDYTKINFNFGDKSLKEADKMVEDILINFKQIEKEQKLSQKSAEAILRNQLEIMAMFNKNYLLENKKEIKESFPYLQELLRLIHIEVGKASRETEKRNKAQIQKLPSNIEAIECKLEIEAPFSNAIYREALQGFLLNKRTEVRKYIHKTEKNKQGFQSIVEINLIDKYDNDIELTLEDLQVLGKIESMFLEYKEQVNRKYLDTYSLTIKKADYQNLLNKNIKGVRLKKIFECLDRLDEVKIEIVEHRKALKRIKNKNGNNESPYHTKDVIATKKIFAGRLLTYALCLSKNNDYTLTFFFPLFETMSSDNNINRCLIPAINELSLKEALEYQIARKLSSMIFIKKNILIKSNVDSGIYTVEIKYSTLLKDLNIEKDYIRNTKEATNEYLKRLQNRIIKALGLIKEIELDKCIVPRASMTTYKSTKIIIAFNYSKEIEEEKEA